MSFYNDTDVFVLLVYFVLKLDIQCSIQMEKWDGNVLDINASAKQIGGKALQLPAMHALTGCDTTPYLFRQGKVAALNTLLKGNFHDLERLGKAGLSDEQLLNACMPFVLSLYGQADKTIEAARFSIFNTKITIKDTCKSSSRRIAGLPATKANQLLNLRRVNLQVCLWLAADSAGPDPRTGNILNFGWQWGSNGIPTP